MFLIFEDDNHVTTAIKVSRIDAITLTCLMPRPKYTVLLDSAGELTDLHQAYDDIPFHNVNAKLASDAVRKFLQSLTEQRNGT